ncbi:MAG: ankyrin repeat domain-containing protein [Fimbriimonadaceae bacterium]
MSTRIGWSFAGLLAVGLVTLGCDQEPIPEKGPELDQALAVAVDEYNARRVKRLIDAGANPNVEERTGWTPLFRIIERVDESGGWETFMVLVDNGADVSHVAKTGMTPLKHAIGTHGPMANQVVEVLLKKGAKLDTTYDEIGTILHYSANIGPPEVTQMLIDAGADVNARLNRPTHRQDQWTPLHAAAAYARAEKVKALLEAGADPNALSREGRTPIMETFEYAQPDEMVETIVALADAKADVSRVDPDGNTVLALALQKGLPEAQTVEVVKALVKAGADPNQRSNDQTPLDLALQSGPRRPIRPGVVIALLDAGAKADAAQASAEIRTAIEALTAQHEARKSGERWQGLSEEQKTQAETQFEERVKALRELLDRLAKA